METIYLDEQYRCSREPVDGLRALETEVFAGKCDAYVAGCRYIPEGESWVRPDGKVFTGPMVSAWGDHRKREAVQRRYEKEQLAELTQAMEILIGGST